MPTINEIMPITTITSNSVKPFLDFALEILWNNRNFLKSPLTPLCQRGEYFKSHFGKGGWRGILLNNIFMSFLSFPLVGNPSLIQKDSGRAGMTDLIPRSSGTSRTDLLRGSFTKIPLTLIFICGFRRRFCIKARKTMLKSEERVL